MWGWQKNLTNSGSKPSPLHFGQKNCNPKTTKQNSRSRKPFPSSRPLLIELPASGAAFRRRHQSPATSPLLYPQLFTAKLNCKSVTASFSYSYHVLLKTRDFISNQEYFMKF